MCSRLETPGQEDVGSSNLLPERPFESYGSSVRPVSCRVVFLPSQKSVQVPGGTLLSQAIVGAGLPLASSCGGEGVCARCMVQILSGGEALSPPTDLETRLLARQEVDSEEIRMACLTSVNGSVSLTTSYW